MFCAGIDIGYSNFKGFYGRKGDNKNKPRQVVKPVGACPMRYMPKSISGSSELDEHIKVLLGDETWACGIEPGKIQNWSRELHANYPKTDTYKALMLMGLLLSEQRTIDRVVTGLPVQQYIDGEHKKAIANKLEGEHQITDDIVIEVGSCSIVPQPIGAYIHTLVTARSESHVELLERGKVVVIDPGHYSLDWILLDEGAVLDQACGTNEKAMSHLLEEVCREIQLKIGKCPKAEKVETALRKRHQTILSFGKSIELAPFLEKASLKTVEESLRDLQRSMRKGDTDVDAVIITGGGTRFYKEPVKELFSSAKVFTSKHSITQNAYGFWLSA